MADVLFNIRPKFVEKVSLAVLKLLMDDLRLMKVLNAAEVEQVTEEHRQRMDQARTLIDMVQKKGDEASNQLMRCLQEKDPPLFNELGVEFPTDQR
ncbi:caspase-1-A-like isoform X2 [Anguilla anguilla]|uniref:caspase-1-A-like isoform X2 n=1 Tax=Anguilla anguilla TaxID=7936 RepID=UPI0015B2B425|nr:caspase-1-A-like isoform X2 [Anguilla anguilla]